MVGSDICTKQKSKAMVSIADIYLLFSDIDECRISMAQICGNGRCVNTPGGFHCECDEGFEGVMMNQMCIGK